MKSIIIASSLAVALAATPALANFYPTYPVGDTVWPAGTEQTITWTDNKNAPNINDISSFKLELQTGTDAKQKTLAVIGTNLKGSDGSIKFTIPADIGPSGKVYFLRFTPSTGGSETIIWSTRFTLTGGTGTFPSDVELPPGSSVSTGTGKTSAPSSPTGSASNSGSKSASGSASATASPSITATPPVATVVVNATETERPTKDTDATAGSSSTYGAEAVLSSVLLAGLGAIVSLFV
ncbi:Ser-Thr-rich glycosyl-phosphatidyl-inositol-anchored membrane family-domain-containing protein [Syncephalis plumigaleata]|nr:Ser-Thr-rich glycosyl-phosphatidyl-inositol-anchored membrane family-domain-containing protein [Syncephalis plumigaleata]